MNNLEIALSTVTAVVTSTALVTAVKTLIDTRNKSVDDFITERNSRREHQIKKTKQ